MAHHLFQETANDDYNETVSQLLSLLSSRPPPFIYVHDPCTPRVATSTIVSGLRSLAHKPHTNMTFACVNCLACFNPRLLFDTALNALAGWSPTWEDGCANWGGSLDGQSQRFNENFDGFTHGLRTLWNDQLAGRLHPPPQASARGKATAEARLILVLENAEKLKETMPDLLAPLARLAELSRVDITTVFVSEVRWDHIRPSLSAAPDPYYIDMSPSSQQSIVHRLASSYPSDEPYDPEQYLDNALDPYTYHPAFRTLYTHFVTTVYNVCAVFTTDVDDLAYVAAATWPAFVRPVIDEYRRVVLERRVLERQEAEEAGEDVPDVLEEAAVDKEVEISLAPPPEEARIRLTRLFTPSITAAFEVLYPRHASVATWATANIPPANLLMLPPQQVPSLISRPSEDHSAEPSLRQLPRMAKFILIASYLASTNPARTDMRIFGRGPDERAKRRRKGGSPRKTTAKAAAVKIPQRLLGPMPFPLDRMIAILGVLLEENDADIRPAAPEHTVPGEYTEMEISRVAVFAQVAELASMHLIHRTSPADRLEMSTAYKSGIGYEAALLLAKDIGIRLNDLIWDPL
ncbi:Origin recognition complex subunit 5 [Phanerochaete sordida]|uniref:Origin recognition complex subunit 5 n=1 Tax=Phanerochaete sordida TaxID=48140 RepID=A0A9P3GEQ1_9APHY|nr:Origin recognition complex subunit 5 [Phanerochaete sordida]